MKNKRCNCIALTRQMNFVIGHIYREGSTRADLLAYKAHLYDSFHWWDVIPCFLALDFIENRYDFTNYRFR